MGPLLLVVGLLSSSTGAVVLESLVAEVCSLEYSRWLDGPGTDSRLLIQLTAGQSSCYTEVLQGAWSPGAVLAFEGVWGGVRQCDLELGEETGSVGFRVIQRNNTWLLDDLCLKQVVLKFEGRSSPYVWRGGRWWSGDQSAEAETAVLERDLVSLERVTAVTCPSLAWWDGEGTQDSVWLEVTSQEAGASCSTALLHHSVSGYPAWGTQGATIFTGIRLALCGLPREVLQSGGLQVRVVKEDMTWGPDELCLALLKLDFGEEGTFTWAGAQWISNDMAESVVAENLRRSPKAVPYTAIEDTVKTVAENVVLSPVSSSCRPVTLRCPDTLHTLTSLACCGSREREGSSCYLQDQGSIARQCPLYSCYHFDQEQGMFGGANGCTGVPNSWLNREVR